MTAFNVSEYAQVADRITEFHKLYPEGSIRTQLVKDVDGEVVFRAEVYRTRDDARYGVFTSGYAREVEGKSPVNRTSHLENAETSAVGRALANLGFAASTKRPSRTEMEKVQRQTADHDAYLAYCRTASERAGPEAEVEVNGKTVRLQEYVKETWRKAKEQVQVARSLARVVERASGIPMEEDEAA